MVFARHHVAAIPVVAGLLAGTGALASYVSGTDQPAAPRPAAAHASIPCSAQTWPYIDRVCLSRGGVAQNNRQVRVVMAPHAGTETAVATPELVTSDTVLRGPAASTPAPPQANEQPAVKKQPKRSETRRQQASRDEFRRVYSVYSVPSSNRGSQPVIVVRPLRIGSYQ